MISMIAAIGKNNELGKNNNLIWHFKEDMQFFKKMTMGHVVIMGRKTYESLPGPLSGRKMVVVSTKDVDKNVLVVNLINKIVDDYKDSKEEVFIVGGESIYKQFLPYANKLYLTEIDAYDSEADTFFPKFNMAEWDKLFLEEHSQGDVNFKMYLYEKKRYIVCKKQPIKWTREKERPTL